MSELFLILGFLAIIVCFAWLVINLFTKRRLKLPVLLLISAFFIFSLGVATLPTTEDVTPEDEFAEEIEEEIATANELEQDDQSNSEQDLDLEEPIAAEEETDTAQERAPPAGTLEAHFIDVGQGDSIFIKTPEKNILIDGGNRGNTVVNYLRNQGVESLDLVIGTHPHADHIGGLINVMQSIPVKEIIDPAVVHTTVTFEDYLDVIDEKSIIFTEGRAGIKRDLGGGSRLKIIHPVSPSSSHLNNASIVCKVSFGQVSFMFTGDAEREAESQILNRGYDLESDILKVGHHGSRTSTTRAFLNAVDPEAAVIMCGRNNQYGHPHQETLSSLSSAGVDIYRTDQQGSIIIATDGETYEINTEPYSYDQQQSPPESASSEELGISSSDEPQGKYVGSRNSDKYHYPGCSHAKRILPQNLVWFNSLEEAALAGYAPCGGCRPPSHNAGIMQNAQEQPSAAQGHYVGSRNSDRYHYPTCGHAKRIKPGNLVYFSSSSEARASGYIPCGTCNPQ